MKGYQVTDKTGPVVAIKVVDGDEDVLLVSDDGSIIRTAAGDISTYSRATQGVRLMRLADGVKVISLARAEKEETEA